MHPTVPVLNWWQRHPSAQFLVVLVLALASTPYTEDLRNGELLEALRLTLVLLSGLVAVGGRRKALVLGIVLATPALTAKWLNHVQPAVPDWTFLVPAVLFILILFSQLMRFILRSPRVNTEVLCAGISGYLLLGFIWALAYMLVANSTAEGFAFTAGPGSGHVMKGFNAIYFSFMTLCTVGYGDIVPASGTARMLAVMEATAGLFYMAVLISRLVSVYSATEKVSESASE